MESAYNPLIPKRAIKAIEKFASDLKAFAEETGEEFPTLYEDANTTFEIRHLLFTYDGTLIWQDEEGHDQMECYITKDEDEETGEVTEVWDRFYEWDEGLRFWRACLKRAKRYWAMDAEALDKIQDGSQPDIDEED